MIKLITDIWKYRSHLSQALCNLEREEAERRRAAEATNLRLCLKHKQEKNHSHYDEINCQYCQAIKRIKELENEHAQH